MKPFEEREKMYQITAKEILNPTVVKMEILAPAVAKKALPGQFIILRVDEKGARIPLTVAGYDRQKGTVDIIFRPESKGASPILGHASLRRFLSSFKF